MADELVEVVQAFDRCMICGGAWMDQRSELEELGRLADSLNRIHQDVRELRKGVLIAVFLVGIIAVLLWFTQ